VERQRWKQEDAEARLSVHNKETQQRLLVVQREREAHEAFLREYEAHVADATQQAVSLEASIVADQANKLGARTKLKETKAFDLSGQMLATSGQTLPTLDKSRSRQAATRQS